MTHQSDETLIDVQLRMEEQMTQTGVDRYMKQVAEAKQYGTEDKLAAAQALMQTHTDTLAKAVAGWQEETAKGRAGNRNIAFKYLKKLDSRVIAYVALKTLLGRCSAVNRLNTVAVALGRALEDETRLSAVRETEKKTYDSIQRGVAKRVSDHYKRVYAIRRSDDVIDHEDWPEVDCLHIGIKLVDMAIETLGWFHTDTFNVGKNNTQVNLSASPALLEQMEKHHGMTALLRPTYEPMVVRPRDWTTPTSGGYLSSNVKPIKLVKISNKAYYEELKHVDMPVVYSAVNALQQTAWQINTPILEVLKYFWERGIAQAGLPASLGSEIPSKPHDIETNEEARVDWRHKAARVHRQNAEERSKRISVRFTIDTATRYNEYPRIYMPYQLDFRGRIYSVPAFNPQGPDYMKALLRFSYGKPLGEHGAQWLAMHGANVAGNDKCSLEERVQWVLDNEDAIVACAADPLGNRDWMGTVGGIEIDKPWQFLAFCMEWKGYVDHGESFVSKLAIALDGSCSGLQHFSAMLRDEIGGAAVNLVPSDTPQDVYGLVSGKVNVSLNGIIASKSSLGGDDLTPTYAQNWLDFGVSRKTTKRSVMTLAYGSRKFGFTSQIMEDILEPALKAATSPDGAVDAKAFPFDKDGYKAAMFMAGQVWDSVTQTLVKSVEAMEWLQKAASAISAEGLPIRWQSPVGFPIMQAYWDMEERRVKTHLQGRIDLIVSEPTTKLDRKAQANGISPNFVHSCDAAHMMLTTVRANQEGINSFAMIHDSFGTTAADTEDLFRIVRESFVEMYTDVDVLEQFAGEMKRQLPEEKHEDLPSLPERGTLDLQGVIASRFCFA